MEQDSYDRFVATLKSHISAARLLIPKHFSHCFADGEDWEECYSGVLVLCQFDGVKQGKEFGPVAPVALWSVIAGNTLDAVVQPGVETSMAVRNAQEKPIIHGGGVSAQLPLNGGWVLAGGPEPWNHCFTIACLMKGGQIDMQRGLTLLGIDSPGVREACEFVRLETGAYVSLMMEMLNLFGLVKS